MRWVALLSALAFTAPVSAQTDTETSSQPDMESATDPDSAPPPERLPVLTSRRPEPDYDGRAEAGPTFAQQLLWIPRVLFFPIYVVWEYLLRVPVGAAVPELEKSDAIAVLFDFFTWEDRNAGVVPTVFFDFGFLPSVGLYFFWNDVFTEGNDVRVWGGFWGIQYLHAAVVDRYALDEGRTEIELSLDFLRRPDQIYGGEGFDARVGADRARYDLNLWQAHLSLRQRFWRESQLFLTLGVEDYGFDDTEWGDEPSVPEAVERGLYQTPANFERGYTKIFQAMYLAIDNRRPRPDSGSGIRLQGYGELGWNVRDIADQRWFRYGGTAGAWLDVGANRTIGLGFGALFADPVGSAPVPFEELIRIDDFPNLISGYFPGDLRGRSAIGLSVIYRYPIWVWLEGVVNVSVTNVFDEHLSDFDVGRLRLTWGLGISTIAERDTSFTFEVAWGTDTFVGGTDISSFRLLVGATEL